MSATGCIDIRRRHVRRARAIRLSLALGLFISLAGADHQADVEVSEQEGLYRVRMVMLVHAPASFVRGVLTDYAHIYRLNPMITESTILPSPASGTVRVKTLLQGCLWFFCRDIDRVEDVRELDTERLQAVIVGDQSDFTSGEANWRIQPVGDNTRVIYDAQFTPGFFIPPIIGSYFVKWTVRDAVTTSFERLECIARLRAGLPARPRQYQADASSGAANIAVVQRATLARESSTVQDHATTASDTGDTSCDETCEQRAGAC